MEGSVNLALKYGKKEIYTTVPANSKIRLIPPEVTAIRIRLSHASQGLNLGKSLSNT